MAATEEKKQTRTVKVRYFAVLKERRGLGEETFETEARTLADLYQELSLKHHFQLPLEKMRVAVGDEFVPFETCVPEQSEIIFIPPVAGG